MEEETVRTGAEAPAGGAVGAGRAWKLGLWVALGYLFVALPLLRSYGATWDTVMMDYPYGERMLEYVLTGEDAYLSLRDVDPTPPVRQPHPNFDGARSPWYHAYPVGALLSALSCRILWTDLGLVPAMEAHNLVLPLLVACLMVVLVRFAAVRLGTLAAVSAALFVVSSPRFFANAFTNLRDVPETCAYVTATLLGYVALTRGGLRWWIATGAMTGIALAAKANALFIPPQFLLFLLLVTLVPGLRSRGAVRWSFQGFFLGGLAVFAANFVVSPHYWASPLSGPVTRVREIMRLGSTAFDEGATATTSTLIHYAPWLVSTTTPSVILILALVGLASRRLAGPLRAFLIAALVVTLGRNMLPGVRNHGGVRHFLEFYPYLCLAAGAGLVEIMGLLKEHLSGRVGRLVPASFAVLCLLIPAWQTARTNPNGVGYFNVFAGGLSGAQEHGIPNATDYWANSYWQAFAWLDEHADQDSEVVVPIAGHVAASIAPVRLRPDLELRSGELGADRPVVYVVFITRTGAYHAFERALEARAEPVHEIRLQGGVLTRVFRIDNNAIGDELVAIWDRSVSARPQIQRIRNWLGTHPAEGARAWNVARRVNEVGLEETLARLREILPERFHPGLEEVLWTLLDR